jgi:hypothetical protein
MSNVCDDRVTYMKDLTSGSCVLSGGMPHVRVNHICSTRVRHHIRNILFIANYEFHALR